MLGQPQVLENDAILAKVVRQEVENVDVSQLHPNENVVVVLGLVREEGRDVEACNPACRRIRLRHHQLDLTVVQVLHVPQLQHVGRVEGDEEAAIWRKSDVTNLVIMSVVNFLLVAFQRENFDHSGAGAHGKHALVPVHREVRGDLASILDASPLQLLLFVLRF